MMVDLYRNYNTTLTQKQLFNWHKMLTSGRRDLTDVGKYRTHDDVMQVVSGRLDKPTIHSEAPPSQKATQDILYLAISFNQIVFILSLLKSKRHLY